MYELTVDTHFDAAHCLDGYQGECARVHGHTWLVSATIRSEYLDNIGLSIDFKIIRRALQEIVGEFDHCILNDHEAFKGMNPTAENIARLIYRRLSAKLDSDNVCVASVTIGEGSKNRLTYRP